MKNKNKTDGFTLVELVIVFVLFGIFMAMALPFFGRDIRRSDLKNNMYSLVDYLRSAENKAMFGRGNKKWGVHLTTNQFVLFKGAVYNPADTHNLVTTLPVSLSLSWALNGGGSDVFFDKIYANSSQFGTITLTESPSANTKIITINQVGMIDYN